MNLKLVLLLSLLGLVVAVESITGVVPYGREMVLWILLVLVWAAILARRAPGKFFLHGFLTGLLGGVLSPLCEALFMSQYLAHNPRAAEAFSRTPQFAPGVLVVILSPILGLMIGVVTGLVTWGWARLTRRATPATPAT